MYDAYDALPILEKLPLQIESIAAYGKVLCLPPFIGLTQFVATQITYKINNQIY